MMGETAPHTISRRPLNRAAAMRKYRYVAENIRLFQYENVLDGRSLKVGTT